MYTFTALLTLLACEPASIPDRPADTGTSLEPAASCPDVCWSWEPMPAPVGCNPYGLEAGTCPAGFTCQTVEDPGVGPTERCVGDGGPYELVAHLDALRGPRHAVELQLHAGGEPWGTRDGIELEVSLTGLHRGGYINSRVPVSGEPLALELLADTYEVEVRERQAYGERWLPLRGVLTVSGDGSVTIDLPVHRVSFDLTLNGRPWSEQADAWLSAVWSSPAGRMGAPPTEAPALPSVWLPEGLYNLEVNLGGWDFLEGGRSRRCAG